MKSTKSICANLIDIEAKEIYPAEVIVVNSKIQSITKIEQPQATYILPGFVDAHIHIESSMIVPSEFARLAVTHGTVATVSDPHEIANVLGLKGVEYMIDNGNSVPFKFFFGASPCVPATTFETAGNKLSLTDVEALLKRPEVKYLSEMMNWPGVLHQDEDVVAKIALAQKYNKPVDGHAPGLMGDQAKAYAAGGMSTDHECFTSAEAIDKLKCGMHIQIREGSAAKNFEALYSLIDQYPSKMMFCSDDKHPDDLEIGHINKLVARAIANGQDLFNVLQVACINPVKHYKLDVGLLKEGDFADFIEIENLSDFKVRSTWVNGKKVCKEGKSLIASKLIKRINKFNISPISVDQIQLSGIHEKVNAIAVLDGELVTHKVTSKAILNNGNLESNTETDTLKIVVVNRYSQSTPAVGFIQNFGLKSGAIASSVAHDSHNIIAIGVTDEDIVKAINAVIEQQGGLSAVGLNETKTVALPVAGLMSNKPAEVVAVQYASISEFAKKLGSKLHAPFMSLSFMALLVIPSIKLSDKGLFDGDKFEFMNVQT